VSDEQFTIPYGSNTYCGPAALAYVTRTTPDESARHLRRVGNKRSIRGVSNTLLLKTLTDLGVRYSDAGPRVCYTSGTGRQLREKPTFKQWWLGTDKGTEYIVNITGHYIVLHNDVVFDNRFHLGKALHLCPYLRRRVRMAWRIER
jgi:hypothetical protein